MKGGTMLVLVLPLVSGGGAKSGEKSGKCRGGAGEMLGGMLGGMPGIRRAKGKGKRGSSSIFNRESASADRLVVNLKFKNRNSGVQKSFQFSMRIVC